jgi:glyoxylase-like metal-dependent hydrolase (beta-lactamase superfamily II)
MKTKNLDIKTFCGGYDSNFFYILSSDKYAAVIDCFDAKKALEYIEKNKLTLKYIISTHGHFDHVEANSDLKKELIKQKQEPKIVMYKSNNCDIKVDEGDELEIGDSKKKSTLKILYTPGHDMDCICILVDDKFLFTGDTLFVGTVGGIFCKDGEKYQKESLKKLMQLPDNTVIYPGHDYGDTETSTIKIERETNVKLKNIIL